MTRKPWFVAFRKRVIRLRLHVRAFQNLAHGYAFSSVQRCRICCHTVYESDRRGAACRYCAEDENSQGCSHE